MQPRSLAFKNLIESVCDQGLNAAKQPLHSPLYLGQDVIRACVNAAKEPLYSPP